MRPRIAASSVKILRHIYLFNVYGIFRRFKDRLKIYYYYYNNRLWGSTKQTCPVSAAFCEETIQPLVMIARIRLQANLGLDYTLSTQVMRQL